MLKILATTENTRKTRQKIRFIIAGNLLKNTRVKLLFAILPELYDTSRAFLFPIGHEELKKSDKEEPSIETE